MDDRTYTAEALDARSWRAREHERYEALWRLGGTRARVSVDIDEHYDFQSRAVLETWAGEWKECVRLHPGEVDLSRHADPLQIERTLLRMAGMVLFGVTGGPDLPPVESGEL